MSLFENYYNNYYKALRKQINLATFKSFAPLPQPHKQVLYFGILLEICRIYTLKLDHTHSNYAADTLDAMSNSPYL